MSFGTSKKRLAKLYKLFDVVLLKPDWLISLQYCLAKNMAAGFFIIDDYEPMCTISLSFYLFIQS